MDVLLPFVTFNVGYVFARPYPAGILPFFLCFGCQEVRSGRPLLVRGYCAATCRFPVPKFRKIREAAKRRASPPLPISSATNRHVSIRSKKRPGRLVFNGWHARGPGGYELPALGRRGGKNGNHLRHWQGIIRGGGLFNRRSGKTSTGVDTSSSPRMSPN